MKEVLGLPPVGEVDEGIRAGDGDVFGMAYPAVFVDHIDAGYLTTGDIAHSDGAIGDEVLAGGETIDVDVTPAIWATGNNPERARHWLRRWCGWLEGATASRQK
ncbi:MAG: hypothetical protein ACPL7L_05200 [bacterium]